MHCLATVLRAIVTLVILFSRETSLKMNGDCVVESNGDVDLQHELKEVEEKFRKAMIANAQLDNDKAAQTYQLELLKDR